MPGIGRSSDTRLLGTGIAAVVTPLVLFFANLFGLTDCVIVSVDPTNVCRFLISVTDRKLADSPSLDASDIDKGEVWSKDPAISVAI